MNRLDLTHLKIWVIDPLDCTDRDDAFSLSYEDENTILWLFIADPTSEFTNGPDTEFENLTSKITTKYYIDNTPDHLFPEYIVKKYSLDIGIKPAICIKVIFDNNLFIISDEILFVEIKITETLSYQHTIMTDELANCIKISNILFDNRIGSGKILKDYKLALPIKNINQEWILHLDDMNTNNLKNMIAEFAILANQIVAKKINVNFNRICENIQPINDPQLFLQSIILNNKKASYEISKEKHLLIDDKVYTHFTSPLRRKSDCIVHFLLKGFYIPINQLIDTCEHINTIVRNDKKRQYNEIKKYTIKAMSYMPKPIKAKLRVNSTFGKFVNLILCTINEFPVQISIVIVTKQIIPTEFETLIQDVNLNGIYDTDILIGLITN